MSPSNNASNDASKPVSNNNGDTNSKNASKIAITSKTADNNQPKVTVSGSHSSHNSSSNKSSHKPKSNSLSLSALSQKLQEPFKNSYSYHERWSIEDSQNKNEASLHSIKEGINNVSNVGGLIINILSSINQFEVELFLSSRQRLDK